MDTVDLVLVTLVVLLLTNIGTAALAIRNGYRAKMAQRENARLATQLRGAGYDTGLVVLSPAEQDTL
jgi:hypothetical protein